MLVENTKFKKDDVVSIKLITGEEVVGKYISENGSFIDIDKPYRLISQGENFGFVPMMITTDPRKAHSIFKSAMAVATPTFIDIRKQYESTVSTIKEPEFTQTSADAKA